MNRNQKNIYCFLKDSSGKYYTASQKANGDYVVSFNARPYPIQYNPINLLESEMEFATNNEYNSMARTITNPLEFVKDGAAILRQLYLLGKGTEQRFYLIVIEWNGSLTPARYELSYSGRIDFSEKKENAKTGNFKVPVIDDSAWGIISQKDKIEYSIDCNATNPKAIKVLVDSITLLNKYTYQTVQAPIVDYNANQYHTIPFVLVNQDGDSAGIITKNQTLTDFGSLADLSTLPSWFLSTVYAINGVNISGSFIFEWSTLLLPSGGLRLSFYTSLGQVHHIFAMLGSTGNLVPGKIYSVDFNFNLNLDIEESIFFIAEMNDNAARLFTITPIVTNIFISTKTKSEPQVVYGLRPLDYLKQLVAKITDNRFTIDSEWFAANNKDIITSGDAIRGIPNAKIYGTFYDFFKTFNAIEWMALRNIGANLFIEKFIEVYKQSGNIIELGEIIDFDLEPAKDLIYNSVTVGSPNQDYRHPSGRLEYNQENVYSFPVISTDKKMDLVTKYRTDCFGIMFLILDYQGQSTQDNSGDKSVFLLNITDDQATASEDIETFENVNINNAPLEPIIKSPLNNDTLSYNKPVLKGIAPPASTVNIYVDGVLDGGTVADGAGNWVYNIVTALTSYVPSVSTGLHTIEATYTTLAGPVSTIDVLIDTTLVIASQILYPSIGDNLYNNKPLVKGVAQHGTNIDISLDGFFVATVVTDNSGKWQYKFGVIPNGAHVISINAFTDSVNINVDTNVAYPLITYIGSELDGFIVINNLPLIQGVAKPGTAVDIWLNYITYSPLGSVLADANGNWSFQVVPINYIDPVSGLPVILAPIRNGLSVISTELINHTVGIVVTGYKLNRPAFSSITGVTDNTVFNTKYSPKRMLRNHYPELSAMFRKQPMESVVFQKASKNGTLRTVLGTDVVAENTDVPVSSLGNPIALYEQALIKVNTNNTFANTLYNFTNGGIITFTSRGTTIYCLPIGSMKISNVSSKVQDWRLLMSQLTTYTSLLNLYKNGTIISLMKNTIYHSIYNTLHFVEYDFTPNVKYNFLTIYQDWFNNRNDAWLLNPDYIQKVQRTDPCIDQIISNGVADLTLKVFRCFDGSLVDTIAYQPVVPAPINPPEIVLECTVDWTKYPEGQYFVVLFVLENPVAISERVQTKDKWLGTVFIESSSSINKVGCFFSTGFKSNIRVEGIVKKLQSDVTMISSKDDSGSSKALFSEISSHRGIRYGTAYGLPDYLAIKVAEAIVLDNFQTEGVNYVLPDGGKIEPSDEVEGHPLFYYNVDLDLQDNDKGKTFQGADDFEEGVILVVDPLAMGLPIGSLINIDLS